MSVELTTENNFDPRNPNCYHNLIHLFKLDNRTETSEVLIRQIYFNPLRFVRVHSIDVINVIFKATHD